MAVPFTNPDITIPVDVIEEIMRIDGLDHIEIPSSINMAPAIDSHIETATKKEKIIDWLTGNGFHEIFTNSITNSKYFNDDTLASTVKTSTGFAEKGASIHAVKLIRAHLADAIKIKASGGIRSYSFAKELINAGANRIGCSASVQIIKEGMEVG